MHLREQVAIVLGQRDDARLAALCLALPHEAFEQTRSVGVESFDLVHVDRCGFLAELLGEDVDQALEFARVTCRPGASGAEFEPRCACGGEQCGLGAQLTLRSKPMPGEALARRPEGTVSQSAAARPLITIAAGELIDVDPDRPCGEGEHYAAHGSQTIIQVREEMTESGGA
jgi:hypothetical protein